MLSILAFFFGGVIGGLRARSKGGNKLDIAQYAAIHGIALFLLVMIAGVIYGRINGF